MAARYTIFAVGVASLLVTLVAAAHEQVLEDKEFADVKFGYSGWNGPDKWGSLSPDFKMCSIGKNQSPINIKRKDLVFNSALKSLDRNYVDTNATLIDNTVNIQLRYDEKGAGSVSVDGKNYTLLQLHWHSPSEHTIDGERYPIELHLVHQSADGNKAVVAILYKYGDADSFFDEIKHKLAQLSSEVSSDGEEVHVAAGEVKTKSLRRHSRKYYRYLGSLTTPPCTESVMWSILGKVRSISKEQVAALQAPLDEDYKKNSRPTQQLNGRTVELYHEGRIPKTRSL